MPTEKTIRPEERPDLTPERNVEAAVRDTFPASDPAATTASQGARAVPPERMMEPARGGDAPPVPAGAVTLTARYPDAEAAKLALEGLVRDGPVDRRCAEVGGLPGGAASLTLRVPPGDADRLRALLQPKPSGAGRV